MEFLNEWNENVQFKKGKIRYIENNILMKVITNLFGIGRLNMSVSGGDSQVNF